MNNKFTTLAGILAVCSFMMSGCGKQKYEIDVNLETKHKTHAHEIEEHKEERKGDGINRRVEIKREHHKAIVK